MSQATKSIQNLFLGVIGGVTGKIVRFLNWLSRGHIHPNDITLTLLVLHVPAVVLIASGHFYWAAAMLIGLNLLSSLDGELARFQMRSSEVGGLLEATADRVKELLLYVGLLYFFAGSSQPMWSLLAILVACGTSLIAPFVKARSEAIIATYGHQFSYRRLKSMLKGEVLTYQLRAVAIALGLFLPIKYLSFLIIFIAVIMTGAILYNLISTMIGLRKN